MRDQTFLSSIFKTHSVAEGSVTLPNKKKIVKYKLVDKNGVKALFLFDKKDDQISVLNNLSQATATVVIELLNSKKMEDCSRLRYFVQNSDGIFRAEVFVHFHYFRSTFDEKNQPYIMDYNSDVTKVMEIEDNDISWQMTFLLG